MYDKLFEKQLGCLHFTRKEATFAMPLGDFSCIDVKQCELKSRTPKDDSLKNEIARKEHELRAKDNILFEDENSNYCDLDNKFTTVTRKRKRRFNWSDKKVSPRDKNDETS